MRNEQKLRKNLKWHKSEIDSPIVMYLLGSVIIWLIIGAILLLFENRKDLSAISSEKIISEIISYTISGIAFGIIMRLYSSYQYKNISKELKEK